MKTQLIKFENTVFRADKICMVEKFNCKAEDNPFDTMRGLPSFAVNYGQDGEKCFGYETEAERDAAYDTFVDAWREALHRQEIEQIMV